jgi:hypothetical protein
MPLTNTFVSPRATVWRLCCVQMEQAAHTGAMSSRQHRSTVKTLNGQHDPDERMVYQIRITGQLGREWTDWLEGLAITLDNNGDTLLTCPIVDQAALYGVLKKVRVGVPLVSVTRMRAT